MTTRGVPASTLAVFSNAPLLPNDAGECRQLAQVAVPERFDEEEQQSEAPSCGF